MPKLILTQGLPASGKTTWAKAYVQEHPTFVIVCRDDIRKMLFGFQCQRLEYDFNKYKEELVTEVQLDIATRALRRGAGVIVADTNLNPKTVARWADFVRNFMLGWQGSITVEMQSFLGVPLPELIIRDQNRGDDAVGAAVLLEMFERYKDQYNLGQGDRDIMYREGGL